MNPFPSYFRNLVGQMTRAGFFAACRLLTGLLLLVGVEFANAQTTNGFSYLDAGGSITITGYNCSSNLAVIPALVNGLPVTSIGSHALYQCTNLTGITIPDAVTNISDYAFYRCTGLTNIVLPGNLATIGDNAFAGSGLVYLSIPASLKNLGDYVFQACGNLLAVDVDPSNPYYSSLDGVLFDKSQSVLLQYPQALTVLSYLIPGTVKTVGFGAFQASKLTSVTIPSGVTSLLDDAFNASAKLSTVSIPEGVNLIGDSVFFGCANLGEVVIPKSVTNIGNYVFYQCGKLTNAPIPAATTYIGAFSFAGTGLAKVILPDGVVSVGQFAFSGCSKLTSIIVPKTVTFLAANALNQCARLSEIQVDPLNTVYSSVGGVLFDKALSTLIQYPPGISASSYTIPNGVTTIGGGAFSRVGLNRVGIPNSVTNIGAFAFSGSSLTSVEIPSGVVYLGNGAFYGCSSLTSVVIPEGVGQIGDYIFQYCYQLAAISIPSSLNRIGQYAFFGCAKLPTLTIPGSVSSIGTAAFAQCPVLLQVNFEGNPPLTDSSPLFAGSPTTVCYLPGATGWGPTYGGARTAECAFLNPVILTTGAQFGISDIGFGFTITWATNASVVIEASPSIAAPAWVPLSTNSISFVPGSSNPSNGRTRFTDSNSANAYNRFYRIRW